MDPRRPVGKTLLQEIRGVIGHGHDRAGKIDKFVETDLEWSGREYVVGESGKAELDPEKRFDPKSGARDETGKMRVHMVNPQIAQTQSELHRLINEHEVGVLARIIESDR